MSNSISSYSEFLPSEYEPEVRPVRSSLLGLRVTFSNRAKLKTTVWDNAAENGWLDNFRANVKKARPLKYHKILNRSVARPLHH